MGENNGVTQRGNSDGRTTQREGRDPTGKAQRGTTQRENHNGRTTTGEPQQNEKCHVYGKKSLNILTFERVEHIYILTFRKVEVYQAAISDSENGK